MLYAVRQRVISPSRCFLRNFWLKKEVGQKQQRLHQTDTILPTFECCKEGLVSGTDTYFWHVCYFPSVTVKYKKEYEIEVIVSKADETRIVMALGKHGVFLFRTPLSVNLLHF